MAYPVIQLLNEAFYTSGILGRGFQDATGDPRTYDALWLLNEIINLKSTDALFIPYNTHQSFQFTPGQESYLVDGLIETNAVTFNIGTVRYPLIQDNVLRYFATGRVDNIESLPVHYFAERALNGTRLYFYFSPQSNYTCNITGKFAYQPVTINDDLQTQFDSFQIAFFRYQLAHNLCEFYTVPFNEEAEKTLNSLAGRFIDISGTDLTVKGVNFGPIRVGTNYAWAAFSTGWVPS